MHNKTLIEWETPDFIHQPKTKNWYWAFSLVTTAVFLAALLTTNFLLAALVLLAAGTIYLVSRRQPEVVQVAITERGLLVADSLLPYREARAFCFKHRHGHLHLALLTDRWLARGLIIPLHPDHQPEQIRPHLAGLLDEVGGEDNLVDALIQRLGL